MLNIVVRRLLQGIVVILGVTIVVFFVTRVIGDPVRASLPLEATPQQYAALEHELGFDRSITTQFWEFLGQLPSLDFGESIWQRGVPARELVLERLPATLVLVTLGMGFAVIVSLVLGSIAALRPGSLLDRLTVTTSLVGLSLPQFWLGLLLVLVFSVWLGWLPTSGRGGIDHADPAGARARPAGRRAAHEIMRSSMIDELNRQYI